MKCRHQARPPAAKLTAPYEAFVSAPRTASRPIRFNRTIDSVAALWTGVRAAMTVFLVSGFWIVADWPHGSTATILGVVATARLATMAPAVPIAVAGTLIFSLSTIPAFIVIDVLLPFAQGFGMFALVVAPMLFLRAWLMAHKKTMLIGYLSALLFASTGLFQNHMTYDPVGLINTSIAAVIATATALVLWAVVAPATPAAARRRIAGVARQAFARIAAPRSRIGLAEFETVMTEALDQLRGYLRDDRPEDVAMFEAGTALLGAGRDLIRIRESPHSPATVDLALQIARLAGYRHAQGLGRARRIAQEAAAKCLAELREDKLETKQVQAAAAIWGSSPRSARNSSAAAGCSLGRGRKECNPMLREIGLFGAGVPSLLLYFLAAVALFLMVEQLAKPLGLYRLVWHPPLVRLTLFVCLFSGLVLLARP